MLVRKVFSICCDNKSEFDSAHSIVILACSALCSNKVVWLRSKIALLVCSNSLYSLDDGYDGHVIV